jgi:hypothetical protein
MSSRKQFVRNFRFWLTTSQVEFDGHLFTGIFASTPDYLGLATLASSDLFAFHHICPAICSAFYRLVDFQANGVPPPGGFTRKYSMSRFRDLTPARKNPWATANTGHLRTKSPQQVSACSNVFITLVHCNYSS